MANFFKSLIIWLLTLFLSVLLAIICLYETADLTTLLPTEADTLKAFVFCGGFALFAFGALKYIALRYFRDSINAFKLYLASGIKITWHGGKRLSLRQLAYLLLLLAFFSEIALVPLVINQKWAGASTYHTLTVIEKKRKRHGGRRDNGYRYYIYTEENDNKLTLNNDKVFLAVDKGDKLLLVERKGYLGIHFITAVYKANRLLYPDLNHFDIRRHQ